MTAQKTSPEESFRPLAEEERKLIKRLLELNFEGRDALAQQLATATAKRLENGALILEIPESAPLAVVRGRVPVEAEGVDEDGVRLHFLLHVVAGRLAELELYRDDGQRIRSIPEAAGLRVFSDFD